MFSDHLGGWAGVQVLEGSDRDAKEAPGLAMPRKRVLTERWFASLRAPTLFPKNCS